MTVAESSKPHSANDRSTVAPAARLDLLENARRIGHYRWIELALFRVLGHWATIEPTPRLARLYGEHCHHHAWHAQIWLDRLPRIGDTDPHSYVVAPSAAIEELVEAMAGLTSPDETVDRLACLADVVVPHLTAVYSFHLGITDRVTDPSTNRALMQVARDETVDAVELESQRARLEVSPTVAGRVEALVRQLRGMLDAAGGIAGRGSTGAAA